MILKKKDSLDIQNLINDAKLAAEKAHLEMRVTSEIMEKRNGDGVYVTANIADTYEDIPEAQQWVMYIFSYDDWLDGLDYVLKDQSLMRTILIEDVSGCSRILLDFLYEYLRLNPEDFFYDELEWYYTYEDIVNIKQKEFDPIWCYKNPHFER